MKRLSSYAFLLSCFLFPLGMIGRISIFDQTINAYWYEIPWTIWILTTIRGSIGRQALQTRYAFSLMVFLSLLLVSFVLSFAQFSLSSHMIAALYAIRLTLYMIAIGVALTSKIKVPRPHDTTHFLLVSTIVVAIIQFVFSPDMWWLYPSGWDPHHMRMVGTFLDSSLSSSIYAMLLLFVLSSPKIRFRKLYLSALAAIFLLTFARGAYVAIFMALMIWALQKKLILPTLLVIAFSCVLLVGIPKPTGEAGRLLRTSTIEARLADYQEALVVWSKHPLFGVGYNHIRDVKISGYAKQVGVEGVNHAGAGFQNTYLVILVTMGVVGLIAYIAVLAAWWQSSVSMRPIITFLGVYSMFDNILLHPHVLFVVTVIMLLQIDLHAAKREELENDAHTTKI